MRSIFVAVVGVFYVVAGVFQAQLVAVVGVFFLVPLLLVIFVVVVLSASFVVVVVNDVGTGRKISDKLHNIFIGVLKERVLKKCCILLGRISKRKGCLRNKYF